MIHGSSNGLLGIDSGQCLDHILSVVIGLGFVGGVQNGLNHCTGLLNFIFHLRLSHLTENRFGTERGGDTVFEIAELNAVNLGICQKNIGCFPRFI